MIKKIFFTLFVVALTLPAAAQHGFKTFAIDNFVSLSLPGEAVKHDTLLSNTPAVQYYAAEGTTNFIAQKLSLKEGNYALGSLPYNEEKLEEIYKEIAVGFLKTAGKSGWKSGGQGPVDFGERKGYSLKLMYNGKAGGENRYFILGDYIYIVSCLDVQGGYNPGLAKEIFNNIIIKPDSPAQFSDENSPAFKIGQMLALPLIIGVVVLIVFLVKRNRKKRNQ